MKSLTFSCLICALNLYFAQKFLRTANLLEVARTAKSCSKPPKLLKSCRAQPGKAYYLNTQNQLRCRVSPKDCPIYF